VTGVVKWHNQPVPKKKSAPRPGVSGVVKSFDADEGWGVLTAPEIPGDCFVHFSSIETSGYRELRAGQRVRFTYEDPGFLQDGCPLRALAVWPDA
jgi:CspA family cold shock protein